MIYFIPAWYKAGSWSENEQAWHSRRQRTEFDDTVKHIQLFHRNQFYEYSIMLLGYTPNFRHFLHRQSMYHAPYWSCFDAMQKIRGKRVMNFSYHDLAWPDGVEFVYSPFVVIAYLNGAKYAEIEFGEDGNMIEVTMFNGDETIRKNIYDDRGFISSTIIYENGQAVNQDFLMENGIWKLRVSLLDKTVSINQDSSDYRIEYNGNEENISFSKLNYSSMEEVIREVTERYLFNTSRSDIFCIAMHERHVEMLGEILRNRKYILSFYVDRYPIDKITEIRSQIQHSSYVITDSRENMMSICDFNVYKDKYNIIDITPYDTRVDKGISQHLHVKKIMVPVDGLKAEQYNKIIGTLGKYLSDHDDTEISLFTRDSSYDIEDRILGNTRDILISMGYEPGWAEKDNERNFSENKLEYEETVEVKFRVEQCVDEIDVTVCMRKQRIIMDLRPMPELYLQVTAISIGVPQIVLNGNQFIENGKNGFIIEDIDDAGEKISYYLDNLSNWNEAVISSYELGRKFTTQVLINRWKEVLNTIE